LEIELVTLGITDDGEIQVAHIVVHCPAARKPPDHLHPVFLHVLSVDFLHRVLVLAHHDGVAVLP